MLRRAARFCLIVVAASAVATASVRAQNQELPQPPPGETMQREPEPDHDADMLLDRLFAQLHTSEDVETAKVIEKAIWGLWSQSQSPMANALVSQAAKAMSASQFRIAVSLLDTAIELKPDFAEAWNKRATAFYLDGQFDKSLADIDKVLDLEPRHFGALSGRGLILRERGDEAGALKAFRRALAIHPNLPAAKRAVKELESEFEQRI